jgi:predicted MFS family arabinose efflux permease
VSRAYLAFLAAAAADAAGYGLIAPIVPAISRSAHVGPGLIGLLVSAVGAGAALGFVLSGAAIRRFGTSAVLAGSIVLVAVGSLGFVVSTSYGVFVAARVLQGIGSGGIWIGATIGIVERFPGDEYRKLTGILAAYSVGSVAGPALGGVGGIRLPFVLYVAVLVPAGLAAALVRTPRDRPELGSDRRVLLRPEFRLASAAIVLVSLGYGALEGPLPLHFGTHLSQAEIGGLFAGSSLVVAASSIAAGRLRARLALWTGAPLLVGGVALAGATGEVAPWLVTVGVASVGFALTEAGSMGVLLAGTGRKGIVLAMVVWSQLWAGGFVAGPAAAGAIVQALGFAAVGLVPLAGLLLTLVAGVGVGGLEDVSVHDELEERAVVDRRH